MKCWAGRITSWNQECQEKYQQPQIMQMIPLEWQKVKRNSRTSWWMWKKTVKKLVYHSSIKKTKIMAAGSITSWQIDEEKMEIRTYFVFFGSKITADGECSHEIKTLAHWMESCDKLDSVLKRRDITLATKVHRVKAMVFPVVSYGCESWTIKKAEHWRTDAFELWCWRRLLRVPWTARRSNQAILKEINPEYSLEVLMMKLYLQYLATWCKEPTHWRRS